MLKINRLAEVLDEKKISNRDIAKHVEKSEETVSRWANNHRQPPLEDLHKIAKFLDVDIKDFLFSTKDSN